MCSVGWELLSDRAADHRTGAGYVQPNTLLSPQDVQMERCTEDVSEHPWSCHSFNYFQGILPIRDFSVFSCLCPALELSGFTPRSWTAAGNSGVEKLPRVHM